MVFEIENYTALKKALEQFCELLKNACVSPDGVFNSKLVVSELVGNVLRHSRGKATLVGGIKDGFVEITVFSTEAFTPPTIVRNADVLAEHGRGLFLVDSVCTERTCTEEGTISVRIKI